MNNFSKLLSDYFLKYLVNQKKASENTIKTYRDAFVLLLEFMESNRFIKAYKIKINDFSYEMINEFLNWLEEVKGVSISTRNNRLAAIKSFFRYVSYIDPEYLVYMTGGESHSVRYMRATTKPLVRATSSDKRASPYRLAS